jgi:hypothetical protein
LVGNRLEIYQGGSSAKGYGGGGFGGGLEAATDVATVNVIFVVSRHGREV